MKKPAAPPPLAAMNARTIKLEAERAAAFAELKAKLEAANGNVTAAAALFDPPITRDRAQHLTRRLGLVSYAAELRLKAGVGYRVEEGSMRGKVMGRPWGKENRRPVPDPSIATRFPRGRQRVYFVRDGDKGLIKIGFSCDVITRMRAIQVDVKNPLQLLLAIDGGFQREQELHARFAEHRQHGEWFYPTLELLGFIEAGGVE